MRYICDQKGMQQLDQMTMEQIGIPSAVLMERAAYCVYEEIMRRKPCGTCLVLAGAGNNGGDGLALARMLYMAGCDVTVLLVGNHRRSEACTHQLTVLRNLLTAKGSVRQDGDGLRSRTAGSLSIVSGDTWENIQEKVSGTWDVVVDSLFGIGLCREIVSPEREVIAAVNTLDTYRVAVDIPSGLQCDTGQILGSVFDADLTVTFGHGKLGMYCGDGPDVTGELVIREIGFLDVVYSGMIPPAYTLDRDAFRMLPGRVRTSNKGTYGRVCVIGGCDQMAGAAYFAAAAAYRSGAGLVKVYSHSANRDILLSKLPEVIFAAYDDGRDAKQIVNEALGYADVLVVGPGIGQSAFAGELVREALTQEEVPVILDADALNILASHMDWLEYSRTELILTPHAKEMERLSGVPVSEIRYQTVETAHTFANVHQLVCVLKGANTVVSDGVGPAYVNTTGNCGMSTGGTGDVLTGVIAAMIAGGLPEKDAAVLGVYMHGLAGDMAAQEKGSRAMLASDLLDGLAAAFALAE